jgi:transmembrane sensor
MKIPPHIYQILHKQPPISEVENKQLQDWYDSFAEYESLNFTSDEQKEQTQQHIWQNISQAMPEATIPNKVKRKRISLRWSLGVAATLLVAVVSWRLFLIQPNNIWHNRDFVAHIATGIHNDTLALQDGSQLILQPGADVAYAIDNEAKHRLVKVNKGSVYFDVSKSDKDFRIATGEDYEVVVYGTTFIVDKRIPERTEVKLFSGSVGIVRNLQAVLKLEPGEAATITSSLKQVQKSNFDRDLTKTNFEDNIIQINNANKEQIKLLFTTYYKVQCDFDKSIDKDVALVFNFDGSASIDSNAQLIAQLAAWNYEIKNNILTFSKKQ